MKYAADSIIFDPLGFRRVDPLPSDAELADFYRDAYATTEQDRGPDVQRLRGDTSEARSERHWRFETQYSDVLFEVEELGVAGGTALDVGSGTGEFLRFLGERPAWQAHGVERDATSLAVSEREGLSVIAELLDEVERDRFGHFDLVTMFNVLEHVNDPIGVLGQCFEILRPGGVLVVQVPNDFSHVQQVTRKFLDAREWWVSLPDHLNYFDFDSLRSVIERTGFTVTGSHGTFPMEFFLIAGVDYVKDPSAGSLAHRRRRDFELSMSGEERRAFSASLASAGLGRNAVVIAQRPAESAETTAGS